MTDDMNALALAVVGLAMGGDPLPPGPPAATVPVWSNSWYSCPGPVAHPFARLPRICPLEPCLCAEGGRIDTDLKTPPWVKEFHQAAHFPLPRFAADGSPVIGDGLLVYEGMRFTVYADGTYDLSFTATVPEMPVTIRLQLAFSTDDLQPPKYFITLPPIRLDPKLNTRPGDPTGCTFQVAHRGQSTLFRTKEIAETWTIRRSGTARFGSPVVADDGTR